MSLMSDKKITFVPIDPNTIQPLPSSKGKGIQCINCHIDNAVWQLKVGDKATDVIPACSKCVLFTSDWGITYKEHIQDFIKNLEEYMGLTFKKNILGVLQEDDDANRVLGGIVMGALATMQRSAGR